jgi:quercetin dioxygenase-like cupin family protein
MERLTRLVFTAPMTERARITPGQTLANPITGERFTFTHTAGSTGGELLAFGLALRPGGAVPIPHVHPIQTERFEVAGRMRFRLGWRTVLAGPGEVVEVAPGVMHGFSNAGEEEARMRVEVRPALAMEEMLAEVVAMARAGRMTRRGLPRNPLAFALLARTYDREAHAPLLSVGAQRLLLAPLVFSARHPRAGLAATLAATLGIGALG